MELNKQIIDSLDIYIEEQLYGYEKTQTLFQMAYVPEVDKYIEKHKEPEPFTVMLNRFREERNLSPKDLYTRAWIDRRLYSQIMGERNYKPARNTAIAFGFGLNLSFSDMDQLLGSAGFTLSKTSEFDLVIKFCIENKIYDITTVNQLLDHRKQPLIR